MHSINGGCGLTEEKGQLVTKEVRCEYSLHSDAVISLIIGYT
jgi:hypothetical protein